ncbi:MAG: hypothetical protein ACE5E6_02700 [Phycisphaerae bacterium]
MSTTSKPAGDATAAAAPGDARTETRDADVDVLALLRRQSVLFARLESLATKQRGLITADDATPLLGVLADRRRVTDDLTALAGMLKPFRVQWAQYRLGLPAGQRDEAERLWADAETRLQGVIDGDARDARLLSAKKETAARTIGATYSSRQALSAYAAHTATGGRLDTGGRSQDCAGGASRDTRFEEEAS